MTFASAARARRQRTSGGKSAMSGVSCVSIVFSYCHLDNNYSFDIVNVKIIWQIPAVIMRQRRALRRHARRRRPPEVARQELLDAAERVFADHHPDRVGLKEIAREAGVSHALITHYFGTYAGLVESTLERRIRRLREHVITRLHVAGALGRPIELLGILFRTLEDPVHLRLMKWLVAS